MNYRADKLRVDAHIRTHTQTDAGNDNTPRPKLASGDEVKFDFQVKFDLEGQGRSPPKIINNKHLNQGVLHLWSKFGDSSLNGWWVIVRTSKWLIHTHRHMDRHTDAGDDNTQRPKLASGKKHQSCTLFLGYTAPFFIKHFQEMYTYINIKTHNLNLTECIYFMLTRNKSS